MRGLRRPRAAAPTGTVPGLPGMQELSDAQVHRAGATGQAAPGRDWERASAILLLILAPGIFADWIAHLLLAATSAINWAEPPAVGLAGSFVWG
jgi:hypothetical protein